MAVTQVAEGRLESSWFALRTRSRCEKGVFEALERRSIDAFLPLYTEEVRWSDRTKLIQRPLFPGYLFVRCDPQHLFTVLCLAGVVDVLRGPSSQPQAIEHQQIAEVRRVAWTMRNPLPCAYVAGEPVEIDRGPLAGTSGVITRVNGATRVIVRIEFLKRAVSVEVHASDLLPVPGKGAVCGSSRS